MTTRESGTAVHTAPMRQLMEARDVRDDWTGLKDRRERRKIQTRLNVRAHRKRKLANDTSKHMDTGDQKLSLVHDPCASPAYIPASRTLHGHDRPPQLLFPMSIDHLIPLIEYNVFRASITNMLILGLFHQLTGSCTYSEANIQLFPPPPSNTIPASLKPTALQKSTPHALWIDLLPSPVMRDNVLRNQHCISSTAFCREVLGELSGSGAEPALVVWCTPWEASGWEVTDRFPKRWRWMLEGCGDLLEATDRWRRMRGEGPLVWREE